MIVRPTIRDSALVNVPATQALISIAAYSILPYGLGTIAQTLLRFVGYDPTDFPNLYTSSTHSQDYYLDPATNIMVSTGTAAYGTDTNGANPAAAAIFPSVSGVPPLPNIINIGVANPNAGIDQLVKAEWSISFTPANFARDLP